MMLGVPMANASFHLAQKIEATLLGQVSEVANKVCDLPLIGAHLMRRANEKDCLVLPKMGRRYRNRHIRQKTF
jgi:hypothetical protein